ncbi:MAG: sigma-54-dependent Fis family transcriptional regulator [Deltaproteobacteria bacterium]|nr:sigma-54-dependent Fis family transcriptional regulator [Deltaproteobacteria bacterium]
MSLGNILVVDDDLNLLELVKMRLETADYEVTAVSIEEEALEALKEQVFDLAIVDLQLAHQDGISLMEAFHQILPDMPVVILTAHGSIESAVEAMKKGAYSYLTKPFDAQELLLQIRIALENRRLTSEVKRLETLLEERYDFSNIVARSEKMRSLLEKVSQIAKTDSTVYIQGESGTGKELIARAIHMASERKNKAFVAINCASLPEGLLESRLFGHEKGAFTGAVKSTRGLFTQAHGGTMFLDEIGDMPLSIQAMLLRALQERNFYPVGSEKLVEVDVRMIVATNKDLEAMVKQGLFREDLYYRIHVIPIFLPPLRERKDDIPLLAEHFREKFSRQMNKEVKGLSASALQKMMLYDWPGNVRELENTMEYAVAITHQDIISEDLILQQTKSTAPCSTTLPPLKEARNAYEKSYLIHLLEICKGNISNAAKLAGKYRSDFYDLLKKHDLKAEDFKNTD